MGLVLTPRSSVLVGLIKQAASMSVEDENRVCGLPLTYIGTRRANNRLPCKRAREHHNTHEAASGYLSLE